MRCAVPIPLDGFPPSSCPPIQEVVRTKSRLRGVGAFLLRQLKLSAFAVAVFLSIPLVGVLYLAIMALGLISVVGLGWGLISAVGWWWLGDANAGKAALISLGYGAGAFVLLVIFWDRVFALVAWLRRGGRDAEFIG